MLGRNFTVAEFDKELDRDCKYEHITPDDIAQAFLRGDEVRFQILGLGVANL